MKLFFVILIGFFSAKIFAQTESLNQLDDKGKKDGRWIVYLNTNWKEVNDSSQATFYKYTYYDHGFNIYVLGPCGKKKWKLEQKSGNQPEQSNKIKLLDGDYKWIDGKGRVQSVHKFKNGAPVFTEFFHSSGKPDDFVDYTKKWEGMKHTYMVCQYTKKGGPKYFYMRKAKGYWAGFWHFSDSIVTVTNKISGDSIFVTSTYYIHTIPYSQCNNILIVDKKNRIETALSIVPHGSWISWYPNGQKKGEGKYVSGKMIECAYWNEQGKRVQHPCGTDNPL